jgi:hypothetical protein
MVQFGKSSLVAKDNSLHQLIVGLYFIFSPENQGAGFLSISQISATYDPIIMMGASVIRLKLNISLLNTFGSSDPPPHIRMNPKISKLRMRINAIYCFF